MARASARKKTTAAKPSKTGRPTSKVRAKKKARIETVSRRPSRSTAKAAVKSVQKSVEKVKKRHSRAEEGKKMKTRSRTSSFGSPTPPPEKPPRLLSESRTTSAALAHLEKGIKLIYQKDFKKARQEFETIAENYPAEAEIIARSHSYLQICDREEAAHRKPAVTQDQIYTLGVMEHNRGNYDGAISHFKQCLERHPDADYIYYSLAASKAMKNEVNEALQNLRKAIELNEDNRVFAKNEPDFSPLHSQKEFTDLVGLNLAPATEPAQS